MICAGRPRRTAALVIGALATACAIAPQGALAESDPAAGTLSPRLAALASPGLLSASPARQSESLSLAAEGPGSLVRRGNRVLVEVRYERGAVAGVPALREAGGQIVHASRRQQTVTVAARPADLRSLGRAPRVAGVTEVLAPVAAAVSCAGLVTSEGDSQLDAAGAREHFNVDGSGVTVGILSDSFDRDPTAPTHASQDVASGDLPGPGNPCGHDIAVSDLDDSAPESEVEDEGRGMAQIVHDLAPGAGLAFATAFNGESEFADNIRALAKEGASVLVDDVAYFSEPFFQDGPVADAVDQVTAAGASYFSAAGNDNLIDSSGREFASWEAPDFPEATSCPPETPLEEHCLDFDPGPGKDPTLGIRVGKKETLTVDLQWQEPWNGVETDIDTILLDEAGVPLEEGESFVGSGTDNVGTTQRPVEFFQWENPGGAAEVQLVVDRCFGKCNEAASGTTHPRIKVAVLENGSGVTETEYPESAGKVVVGPTVYGHAGADAAIAVGAISFQTDTAPERYSSRGPVTHYFGPVSGSTPAAALSPPQTIHKPDVVATDCGLTTFFVPTEIGGIFRFCGTSAAAPHAAAVAALLRQANPSISPTGLRTALASTARPVGAFSADAVGAGLIDAEAAVGSVAAPPVVTITEPPAALSSVRQPRIGFSASRPATFACSLDGGPLLTCASPFVPEKALEDGLHGFAVEATDAAGRVGDSETAIFTVDTKAPRTFLRRHPPHTIRTKSRRAKAVFAFRSDEAATFTCRVDRGLSRFCPVRISRRFSLGQHVLRVKAVDGAGNVDPTPVVFHFVVKQTS